MCGGVLLVVALIVKSALGMGDVKLFFALGLFYGLQDDITKRGCLVLRHPLLIYLQDYIIPFLKALKAYTTK